jgi:hypothetical protein
MRPVIDYSKQLRRKLAEGRTFDQALSELRASGASIFDCIASVRAFRKCELAEAKLLVQSSPTWSDHREITAEVLKAWAEPDENGS